MRVCWILRRSWIIRDLILQTLFIAAISRCLNCSGPTLFFVAYPHCSISWHQLNFVFLYNFLPRQFFFIEVFFFFTYSHTSVHPCWRFVAMLVRSQLKRVNMQLMQVWLCNTMLFFLGGVLRLTLQSYVLKHVFQHQWKHFFRCNNLSVNHEIHFEVRTWKWLKNQ